MYVSHIAILYPATEKEHVVCCGMLDMCSNIFKQLCKFHVEVFWVVTMCSVAVGYQYFREHCCFHLQVFQHTFILPQTTGCHDP
jgi:hypothetical protein